MMKFRRIFYILLTFFVIQENCIALTDSEKNKYVTTRNKDGVKLVSNKLTIFLGNGCDAFSPDYGWGNWGWANGGVIVNFGTGSIGFPRQDSPFEDGRCAI